MKLVKLKNIGCYMLINLIYFIFISVVSISKAEEYTNNYFTPIQEELNKKNSEEMEIPVIFLRLSGKENLIATVFIDDKIVGSLPPNTYTKGFICKREFKAGVAERGVKITPPRFLEFKLSENVENERKVFILVEENLTEEKFNLKKIDKEEAEFLIEKYNLKSRILNRKFEPCYIQKKSEEFDYCNLLHK